MISYVIAIHLVDCIVVNVIFYCPATNELLLPRLVLEANVKISILFCKNYATDTGQTSMLKIDVV